MKVFKKDVDMARKNWDRVAELEFEDMDAEEQAQWLDLRERVSKY